MGELCWLLNFGLSIPNPLFCILFFDSLTSTYQTTVLCQLVLPQALPRGVTKGQPHDWRREGTCYFLLCQCHHINDSSPWQPQFIPIVAVDLGLPFLPPVRTSFTVPPVRCSATWQSFFCGGLCPTPWYPSPEMPVNYQKAFLPQGYSPYSSSSLHSCPQLQGVIASSYSNYFCDSSIFLITIISDIVHFLFSDTWWRIFNIQFSVKIFPSFYLGI